MTLLGGLSYRRKGNENAWIVRTMFSLSFAD